MRKWRLSVLTCLAVLGIGLASSSAAKPCCTGHIGIAGCDPTNGVTACQDGTEEFRCPCSSSTYKNRSAEVVPIPKPSKAKGEILDPGQKPPAVTLEQSKKDTEPSSTTRHE